jgi:hypothetical protein
VAAIKMWRLEWIGHVVGTDQRRTVKKIFENDSKGSRRSGRPRLKWLEDIVKDRRKKKSLRDANSMQLIGKNGCL